MQAGRERAVIIPPHNRLKSQSSVMHGRPPPLRTQHGEALTMNILNQVDTGGDGAGKGSVYSVSGPGECVLV